LSPAQAQLVTANAAQSLPLQNLVPHPLTLMSLGASIAQGGIGRGLALATAAAQAERNLQAQEVNHAHVLNALTGAGLLPDEALAAVPRIGQPRSITARPETPPG